MNYISSFFAAIRASFRDYQNSQKIINEADELLIFKNGFKIYFVPKNRPPKKGGEYHGRK
jgi:endonuclease V-like protein UPF0215 family